MIEKDKKVPWLIIFLPILILILGSSLHFLRGSFAIGDTAVKSWGVDDAYISYRYSWNLTHFNILSWNESGFQKTEGFTNPLWVFLGVAWSLFGKKDWVYPLSVISSILISSLLFAILILSVLKKHKYAFASIFGLISVAFVPALWLHMSSGLESVVFGVGLAALAYIVIFAPQKSYATYLIFSLAFVLGLLRSDGIIYLGIILAAGIIAGSKNWKPLLVGIILPGIILFSWRYITYGTLLPNTAIAKLNFSLAERIQVALMFLRASVLYSGLIVFLIYGIAGLWLESRRILLSGLFIILGWISYYLYIGGDGYFERHLVGLYFIMAALSAPLWLSARVRTRYLFFLVVLLAGLISIRNYQGRFNYLTPKATDPWIMLGKAMEINREHYGVHITFAAGKIPFFAGGNHIDMLGLTDPVLSKIQQEKFVPGHSAGDAQAAIEIAKSHPPGTYSTFSYLDPYFIRDPRDVSLWVNNFTPQDTVNHGATEEQWQTAKSAESIFIWSVISEPVGIGENK